MHLILLFAGGTATGITLLTGGDTGYTYAPSTASEPELVATPPAAAASLSYGPPASGESYTYGPSS